MTPYQQNPTCLINPVSSTEVMWSPHVYQMVLGHKNPSYLNSLWLGTVWNLLLLPFRVAIEVLWPLFNFELQLMCLSLWYVPVGSFRLLASSLSGHAMGLRISCEQMVSGRVLTPAQGRGAVASGFDTVVIEQSHIDEKLNAA